MKLPEEEKEEPKEEDEEDIKIEVVDESIKAEADALKIKREFLRPVIEDNVAPPIEFRAVERSSAKQEEIPPDFDIPITQMEVPLSESMVGEMPPSIASFKPQDKILVKTNKLMAEARKLTVEYKYEAALQKIHECANLLKKPLYVLEHAQALLFGGHILNTMRNPAEAKNLLQDALAILKGTSYETKTIAANIKVELGIATQRLGQSEEALAFFSEAGELYQKRDDQSGYIRSLWNKGIVYYNNQKWQDAIKVYLEIAKASADQPTALDARLRSLQKIADLIQMVGKLSKEDFDTNEYLKEIHLMKDDYEQALAHEVRAMTKRGELERIEGQAVRDPANLALWHFNLAAAETTTDSADMASAMSHFDKAIELYKKIGDKFGLSRCYHYLALIKEKENKIDEAINLLKDCIKLREDLKETLQTEEYRTALQFEIVPIYDDLSYLEALKHNYQASLNAIEQSKSRELINHLANEKIDSCPYVKDLLNEEELALEELRKLEAQLYQFRMRYSDIVRRGIGDGEPLELLQDRDKLEENISLIHNKLQDYRRDIWMKCIDTGNVKPPIQYNIYSKGMELFNQERNWAILEFIWIANRQKIMVYFITNETIKLFESPLDLKEVTELLEFYKKELIEENSRGLETAAQKFSNKIIPEELFVELEKSENIQYLFIIPHKELHSIPFEIIKYKNQYWGLKYSVVKNFSLDLSRITLQKRIAFFQKNPKITYSALVIGNPTLDLANAELEAKEVARLLEEKGFKVKLLRKQKSKEEEFIKNAELQTIIHFAGHGVFITPEPILSHLLFASSSLTAREITELKLKNIPIVVLSACETAIQDILGGNELVGLVRSFILAGSTTLVTTNWPVSDVSAQELIEKFYEFLLMGGSVGISLQKARQFIAQKYDNQIIHWAAYTLFGDPFRKLMGSSS
ncbi:MAG TPA: CHAT domain-containing tetratricopeptide repeat protein [Candidatus Deferrimicrobium sp.]|nr:CHAT domain-containing tetratricopeptide repeat protein [Candidatus Deferrimicrobium sp.]